MRKIAKKQQETQQERLLSDLAMSVKDQINSHMDNKLEPKLDVLLAKKVKLNAVRSNYF